MRIVVTGSMGFVGSRLVPHLQDKGHQVIGIDIRLGNDITDSTCFADVGPFDVLVHLAAMSFVPESYRNPAEFYHVNVTGTINAAEAARKAGARMIFLSSYVYGNPRYTPTDERHPVQPHNPYARTKVLGEEICRGFHRDFDLPVLVFRPFNIYGPGQGEPFLIPRIVNMAKTGRIELGNPLPERDFLHVDDCVNAIALAIDKGWDGIQVINLGSGKALTVRQTVDLLVAGLDPRPEIVFSMEQRKGDILRTLADIGKAGEFFGWQPLVEFPGLDLFSK